MPGENLHNVLSARSFVNWYNAHPDFLKLNPDLSAEDAVVVGHGNVGLDCARILCKSPEELRTTDIAAHAVEALQRSAVKRVHLVGRRSHVQAQFTMKARGRTVYWDFPLCCRFFVFKSLSIKLRTW